MADILRKTDLNDSVTSFAVRIDNSPDKSLEDYINEYQVSRDMESSDYDEGSAEEEASDYLLCEY